MENYKGFVLNYSAGKPKPLVLTTFCLGCYSKNRRRKLANYSVCAWVCVGGASQKCGQKTSREVKSPRHTPCPLQVALRALWCQHGIPEVTQPGRHETWRSIQMDPFLVVEQKNPNTVSLSKDFLRMILECTSPHMCTHICQNIRVLF